MSDPLADECAYCGSPHVLDDAWFCDRVECWQAYEDEGRREYEESRRERVAEAKAKREGEK